MNCCLYGKLVRPDLPSGNKDGCRMTTRKITHVDKSQRDWARPESPVVNMLKRLDSSRRVRDRGEETVTYVSGTMCYLCLGPLTYS